jgi:hypothetical protein
VQIGLKKRDGRGRRRHKADARQTVQRIVLSRLEQGADVLTFTPEFGPPGYMPVLPYTKQPVADLWELNLWMAERLDRIAREAAEEYREGIR